MLRLFAALACFLALLTPPSASAAHRPSQAVAPAPHYLRPRGARIDASPAGANLVFGGQAAPGIQVQPRVYVSFYGRQWGAATVARADVVPAHDPAGMAPRLQDFLRGLYGSEHWSTSTTQYCDGVRSGTVLCGTSGRHVGHASTTPLAGVWIDATYNAPAQPSVSSFRAAAVRAAKHFGNTTAASNASVQYVIVTPTGIVPPGFGSQFCAYHDWYTSSVGGIAFVALPYVPDAGSGCGAGLVHRGTRGALDGVTIVAGHEYAEALTDLRPPYGWVDMNGEENGAKCAWIATGSGAATDVTLPTGTFPMQSLWSNTANGGRGGCVTYYASATNQH